MRYFNTAEADLIEIIIVRLGGENQDQKGLVDFLYGLFSGNQEKVLSYIPDSDKPVRQKPANKKSSVFLKKISKIRFDILCITFKPPEMPALKVVI